MKLLFDENLSLKLPHLLAALFPGSAHVRECGVLGQPDEDSDFQQRSLLYGHPPKLVWLRIGNCTRQQLVQFITTHEQDIHALETDPFESVLVLL